jgi:acyl carrier protein
MPLSAQSLKTCLIDELGVDDPFEDETLLFSTSIIDSFQMMSLLAYVEKECGIKIPSDDVTFENFDSVQRIVDYLGRRGGG